LAHVTKTLWPHRPYRKECPGGSVDFNVPVDLLYYKSATSDDLSSIEGIIRGLATYYGDWYAQVETATGIQEINLNYLYSLRFFVPDSYNTQKEV